MTTLTEHTVRRIEDKLNDTVHVDEFWVMPFGDQNLGGNLQVERLQSATEEGETDLLLVSVKAQSRDANWSMYWASDPEVKWNITDPHNERVTPTLPSDLCLIIEQETGLDLSEARTP